MWVAVGHLIGIGSSGKALDAPSCIARLTDVFEMVSVLSPVTDTVQSRFFGHLGERVYLERIPLGPFYLR
jgi:hypothetical protein